MDKHVLIIIIILIFLLTIALIAENAAQVIVSFCSSAMAQVFMYSIEKMRY